MIIKNLEINKMTCGITFKMMHHANVINVLFHTNVNPVPNA
jgi:hypothetical protein